MNDTTTIERINNALDRCRIAPGFRVGMFFSTYENMKIVYDAIVKENSVINSSNAEIKLRDGNRFEVRFDNGSYLSAFVLNGNCIGQRWHTLMVDNSIREIYVKEILRCSISPYIDKNSGCQSLNPKPVYFNVQEV